MVFTNAFKELGFAMFFLNRTNRSGILDAGPIGGYDQSGTYKIDCRFNKEVLIKKISKIAECKNSVRIYNQDISAFLRRFLPRWKNSGEMFIDIVLRGERKKGIWQIDVSVFEEAEQLSFFDK